ATVRRCRLAPVFSAYPRVEQMYRASLRRGDDVRFKPANVGKPARPPRFVRDMVARAAVPAKQGRNHPFPTLASTGRARVIGKILGAEGDRNSGRIRALASAR